MANPFFAFKQFTVFHDQCAMKVGTDGVLLGAWVRVGGTQRILDVGTGTGLIALMLAQRSTAQIEAIDIDESAYRQACRNVFDSPFAGQIRVCHSAFADYDSAGGTFDLIVSNPPYFSQSLKSPDEKRSKARHDELLPLEELIAGSVPLLSEKGRIALILPVEQDQKLTEVSAANQLHRIRQTNISPTPHTPVKRILVELSPTPNPDYAPECLTIEIERHRYTEAYETLTRDFYLKM
ncbi:methyltransferase [Parabacteroides sp. PF5-6]|uniref:tRNA1(Val) (adenine(37)-N6)-methyltransferase n=1 Tax=Parabacteroides sp. PF5-6 TaxID=1742403 RepID=UPI0024054978|nr:methyltransferase [Parabacteroides sp. PF5-6]MDF9829723.1 tRNA1Val (adenine37-N6)-methyltransferase [Parabacteroides sp. PF5-6]